MQQNQNSLKNFFISAGLLTFIVSSGAFTVYQVIKARDYSNNNTSSISSLTSSTDTIEKSTDYSAMQSTEISKNSGETVVTFDPYTSGDNVTGSVDKPENVQSLIVRLTDEAQPNNILEFKPVIDSQKKFKIVLDSNVKDAQYKVDYMIIDFGQKETNGSTVINVKMNTESSTNQSSTPTIKTSEDKTALPKSESNIQSIAEANTSTPSTQQSSEVANSIVEGKGSKANMDAVRTGGTNSITIPLVLSLILFLGYITKKTSFRPSINTIFGK
jgi:hypothetical protein